MFVMPVALRTDFDAVACRLAAKRSKDGPQARRLLTLAAIYEGASRSEAARIGGVTVQIVRDWVLKFKSGPMPAIHGVVRWRLVDLAQWLLETFRVRVARQTLSRELRAMGYRKLSARPRHHAQVDGAIEAFKKISPPAWRRSRATRASIPTT